MHLETSRRQQVRKDGTEVVYERHLLRRSFRNVEGKPDKEALANLSALPAEAIAAIRAAWPKHPPRRRCSVPDQPEPAARARGRGVRDGPPARAPALLGPAGRERDVPSP
jgi:hypothetical protein